MSYYKARMYSPTLGRFMQTDPIGYGDGLNWYNYVGSDPVNFVDPSGLEGVGAQIDVFGPKRCTIAWSAITGINCGSSLTSSQNVVEPLQQPRKRGGVGGSEPQNDAPCPAVPANVPGYLYGDPEVGVLAAFAYGRANTASEARFPNLAGRDDVQDAYRHFYGAMTLARSAGGSRALGVLNVNEAWGVNERHARAMDDHNNYTGVVFGSDPRYAGMSVGQAAEFALKNGCLVTAP